MLKICKSILLCTSCVHLFGSVKKISFLFQSIFDITQLFLFENETISEILLKFKKSNCVRKL